MIVPRKTDCPFMQLPINNGEGKCLRMLFKWDIDKWTFTGWGDVKGELIAAAETDKCGKINFDFAVYILRLREAIESKPAEPLDFGMDMDEVQDRMGYEHGNPGKDAGL